MFIQEALAHPWLKGETASDHNLLPEIRAYVAKARLRRGIELVKLANRIEALKMQEDEEEDVPGEADVPANAKEAAGEALGGSASPTGSTHKRSLSKIAKGLACIDEGLAADRTGSTHECDPACSMKQYGYSNVSQSTR